MVLSSGGPLQGGNRSSRKTANSAMASPTSGLCFLRSVRPLLESFETRYRPASVELGLGAQRSDRRPLRTGCGSRNLSSIIFRQVSARAVKRPTVHIRSTASSLPVNPAHRAAHAKAPSEGRRQIPPEYSPAGSRLIHESSRNVRDVSQQQVAPLSTSHHRSFSSSVWSRGPWNFQWMASSTVRIRRPQWFAVQ